MRTGVNHYHRRNWRKIEEGITLYNTIVISHTCDTDLVIDLSKLRRTVGITQVQLAGALGTSQGQISRIESQRDMLLSTLTAYLAALGVDAKIVVELGDQIVTYDLTVERGKR